jgi:hypothetical protein
MSWHRLILMDVLGRQGFLTKPGTARAQAAVAINALSRFVHELNIAALCLSVTLLVAHFTLFEIDLLFSKRKAMPKKTESQKKNSKMIDVSFDRLPRHFKCPRVSSWINFYLIL